MGRAVTPIKKTPRVIPWKKTKEEPPLNAVVAEAAALGISIPHTYRYLLVQDGVIMPAHYLPHWDAEDVSTEDQQASVEDQTVLDATPASAPQPKKRKAKNPKPKAKNPKPRPSRKKTNPLPQPSSEAPADPAPQEFAPDMYQDAHAESLFDTHFGRPGYSQQDMTASQANPVGSLVPPVPSLRLNTKLPANPPPTNRTPRPFLDLVPLNQASRHILNAEIKKNDQEFDIALPTEDQTSNVAILAFILGMPPDFFGSDSTVETSFGNAGGLSEDSIMSNQSFGSSLDQSFDGFLNQSFDGFLDQSFDFGS
ncbi:uncharacterized protein BDZ99DRAFT_468445 [Mytilinidion resinicola]|uniref:Uncharacterized protein n=1 Tax=Mytilinidion resinicola TaxID=574789 RepID=A0A6A6Y383_9PEZI|nr:uncharacterized protein BDZ99DRAFT_468445 [Mytilinidion resinicola]KAF2803099.1 hypothetical protein BDZ99DRAFT_468445 [Mytilinidion resinicola]